MKRPAIPQRIRKKANRSGTFHCAICKNKSILVTHHIKGRNIKNANHPSNLVNICDNCHRKIHEGKIIIEGWFMTTSGMTLLWHCEKEESFSGNNQETYIIEVRTVSHKS